MPKKNNKKESSQLIEMPPDGLKTMMDILQENNDNAKKSIDTGLGEIKFLENQGVELADILSNILRDNAAFQKEIDELKFSLKEEESNSQTSVSIESEEIDASQNSMTSDNDDMNSIHSKKKVILDDRGRKINALLGDKCKKVYLRLEQEVRGIMEEDPDFQKGLLSKGVSLSEDLCRSLRCYHEKNNPDFDSDFWIMDGKNTTFAGVFNRFNNDLKVTLHGFAKNARIERI